MTKRFILPILFLIFAFGLISNNISLAQENLTVEKGQIVFFSSAICPHCAKEREFLDGLKNKYPDLKVQEYEVVYHPENQQILKEYYDKYNIPEKERGFVPVTFTASKYFIGFSDQTALDIENCLKECFNGGNSTTSQKIKIPIFGEVDISKTSLLALTAIFGTLDGFNPCAMWVLVILVSMLLGLKSRKKIALVGGTFIFAEGLLYFLFMSAWLNAFLFMGQIYLIRIGIGIFGLVFGVMRIRDFIKWRPGVCKVTEKDANSQEKIWQKIQNLAKPTSVPATFLGVVALAFGVNIVEFFCSAGFPVMYTKILASQGIGGINYYLYLLLYNLFYMIDDFIVFGVAFFTLSHFKFSDRYNRYSTLVAGLLILILGILLIFKPGLLMFG